MVDVAKARLFGQNVGTFSWDDAYGVARFEYDKDFLGRGIEPSPLMMPVQEGRIYSFGGLNRDTFCGLPGMLADSLPDTCRRSWSLRSKKRMMLMKPFAIQHSLLTNCVAFAKSFREDPHLYTTANACQKFSVTVRFI